MPTLSEFTDDQFIELLNGYYAKPKKRHKMTMKQIRSVAEQLNKKINVPIIKETKEEKILIKIVMAIDTFLYDHIPNEFYDVLMSSDGGIDDEEAKRLISSLSKLANEKINIPYVPEQAEYIAIRFVIGIVVNAARKRLNVALATAGMAKIGFPTDGNISDSDLLITAA